jgi:hypothetical protein
MKVVAKQYSQRAPVRLPAWLVGGGLLLFLAVLVAGMVVQVRGDSPTGALEARVTFHDFGEIPLAGGLVETRFPLEVQGDTLVTELVTSCMCTRARLVQGEQVSGWYSMTHGPAAPAARVRLDSDIPALLEITMDPAAHGPQGVGAVERGIILKTASGQELQFVLAANVTP